MIGVWEYRQIEEDGGMGWAREQRDFILFAWGAGAENGAPHPGGWSRILFDEDGDLDEEAEHVTDSGWTAEKAKAEAERAYPSVGVRPETLRGL